MKVKLVINKCYGGFGLSPLAVKRMAELKGRPCYFFSHNLGTEVYTPLTLEQASDKKTWIWFAYDIPNPTEVFKSRPWSEMTTDERIARNKLISSHSIDSGREVDRADATLVQVVEELGDKANGAHAKLAIVEIPDGVTWELDEYDGIESVHETHRSWS